MEEQSVPAAQTARRLFSASMPFDPETYAARLPDDAMTRGMFFHSLRDALVRRDITPPEGRFIAFKRYSLRVYHAYILECARLYCPEEPLAQGVFELGISIYPAFASSMVGKAIFAVAGIDLQRLIQLAPRGYNVANTYGECIVRETSPTSANWRLKGVWDYLPFSMGISEGAARACKISTLRLEYVAHDIHDVEFWATW